MAMKLTRDLLARDADEFLRQAKRHRYLARTSSDRDRYIAKAARFERMHEVLTAILMHRPLGDVLCMTQLPDDIGADTWTLHDGESIELSRALERCERIEQAIDAAPGFCAEQGITSCYVSRERIVETRRLDIENSEQFDGGIARLVGAA
jgi:hypothetical protein